MQLNRAPGREGMMAEVMCALVLGIVYVGAEFFWDLLGAESGLGRITMPFASAVLTWFCCLCERTVLEVALCVKTSESDASMIAPAKASPNDSPNEPAAELTPAASLTRSSTIGDSV
jgi:hypothetical protein